MPSINEMTICIKFKGQPDYDNVSTSIVDAANTALWN